MSCCERCGPLGSMSVAAKETFVNVLITVVNEFMLLALVAVRVDGAYESTYSASCNVPT